MAPAVPFLTQGRAPRIELARYISCTEKKIEKDMAKRYLRQKKLPRKISQSVTTVRGIL